MSFQLADRETLSHTDFAFVDRVTSDHVGRCELVLVDQFGLSEPSREKTHRGLDALLGVDLVDVLGDLSVVDERQPRLEALLDELVLLLGRGEMSSVEEIVLIRVEVGVALDLLQTTRVSHQDHIEVTGHGDSRFECWNGSQLAKAIDKGDETDCEHHGEHTHQELLLALAKVVDDELESCAQDSKP